MNGFSNTRHRQIKLIIGLLLILSILMAYWKITECDFVGYDDRMYVTDNRRVQKGLTAENLVWAFTTFQMANWHPLTLLSHMLDCQLYGLNPLGHHWTSLQLHMANTLLLFYLLQQMTGALWRSAFVAALFALHPLHVESVAWVAERKDVLSTFFGFLAVWAYLRYARQKRFVNYLLVLIFFSLGLMAKPMLVTMPFVLLLLDFWPLERLQLLNNDAGQRDAMTRSSFNALIHLIYEKIPLFALATLSSIVTFWAQRSGGSVESLESLALTRRVANAFVAYVKYIIKTVWPTGLSVFYPHPREALPLWQGIGAALLIAALSYAAVRSLKKHPYIAFGWFWYLGTLVPVIGLVQVGFQGMADRYTYIPLTGLFIIVAWGVSEVYSRSALPKALLTASAVIVLLAMTARTFYQVSHWQNILTLFENAVTVAPESDLVRINLGTALSETGDLAQATIHFRKAVEINPDSAEALSNLGIVLYKQGFNNEAARHLRSALKKDPKSAVAYSNLGMVLLAQNKSEEAVVHIRKAVDLKPAGAGVHNNLANALTVLGKYDEAARHYAEAIELEPEFFDAHYNFGNLLIKQEKFRKAMVHFAQALKINPEHSRAYHQIGVILSRQGRYAEARRYLTRALQIDPDYEQARRNIEKIVSYE